MNPLMYPSYVENEERMFWLRRMCKGVGVRRELRGVPLDLFGMESWDQLVTALHVDVFSLPPTYARYAAGNALNLRPIVAFGKFLGGTEEKLVARREELAKLAGVTSRTMEHHEEVGLNLVDYEMGIRMETKPAVVAWSRLNHAFAPFNFYADGLGVPQDLVLNAKNAISELGLAAWRVKWSRTRVPPSRATNVPPTP